MIKFTRETARAALAFVLSIASIVVWAAGFPERPIRLVVGFPPGGGADFVARQVAQSLGPALGGTVVVENKPGANGTIAAADVARAAPDGYTLLLGVTATQSISPVLMPKLPYDALRDFSPITMVGLTPLVLVISAKTPVNTVGEFRNYVQAAKEPVTYGSAGTGNITHMAAELFVQSTGLTNLRHIPYKGSSQVVTDLLGGHIVSYFDTLPSSLPFIQSGQLRALAVTSGERSSAAPSIPTMQEAGVTGYYATTWFGVLGPGKMSSDLIELLYEALRKSLGTLEAHQALIARGVEPVLDTPAHFRSEIETDLARWKEVTHKSKITME